jgi:hypothetical protein
MSAREGIHLRLSYEERNALERAALRGNKSRSQIVRELIMGLQITDDLKRSQADEARVIRIALETEIESLRRELSQALLDFHGELRNDIKRAVVSAVEAATGKKVITNGESK